MSFSSEPLMPLQQPTRPGWCLPAPVDRVYSNFAIAWTIKMLSCKSFWSLGTGVSPERWLWPLTFDLEMRTCVKMKLDVIFLCIVYMNLSISIQWYINVAKKFFFTRTVCRSVLLFNFIFTCISQIRIPDFGKWAVLASAYLT